MPAWVTWGHQVEGFKPDTPYTFSAWVKSEVPDTVQVVFGGVTPFEPSKAFFYFRTTENWRRVTTTVVGDAGSDPTVQVILLNEGRPGTFYFDDVSFSVRD